MTTPSGSAGKTSIRGGFGVYYDHFGEGVVNTFDREGSLGLTTLLENPSYVSPTNCAARFCKYHHDSPIRWPARESRGNPVPELAPPPTYGFPYTPPGQGENGSFAIGWEESITK